MDNLARKLEQYDASCRAYESVINEQAEIIQNNQMKIDELSSTLSVFKIKDKIARERGAQTRAKNKVSGKYEKKHYFVKVMRTVNQKARRSGMFTPAEKQLLFDILPFIDHSAFVVKENKNPMTISDIGGLCEWSRSHTSAVVNNLVKKEVLEKIKNGKEINLKVSPEYFKFG